MTDKGNILCKRCVTATEIKASNRRNFSGNSMRTVYDFHNSDDNRVDHSLIFHRSLSCETRPLEANTRTKLKKMESS